MEKLMFACGIIWGACAVAVIAVMKARSYRRIAWQHGGYGHGCGGGGWAAGRGGYGPSGGWEQGAFRRFGLRQMVRGLFMRLGTTPGQEKAIVKAMEDLRAVGQGAKEQLRASRKDFAEAFRRGPIDEPAMAEIFARHDAIISESRRKVVESVGQIHEALDDQQRAEVANLIESGFSRGYGYRG